MPGTKCAGLKSRLFNFGEIIVGIAIQDNSADRHQWVVAMRTRPLCQTDSSWYFAASTVRMHLHFECPGRIVPIHRPQRAARPSGARV